MTSNEHDTHQLKVRLSSEHEELSERVLSEVFESLDKALEEILEHVANLTLFAYLLVVEEPESVAFSVNLFHELGVTLTLFVRTVDEESFEVEEIEGRRGQELELAFHLLLSWLFTIIFGSLGLGGSSSGLGLLLRLDDGFDSFLGHLNHPTFL